MKKNGVEKYTNAEGFTLIELLITLAIVAILAATALPAFQSLTQKARRVDAKSGLVQTAQALEACFTAFNSYNNAECTPWVSSGGGIDSQSPDGYYRISSQNSSGVEQLSSSRFTLYAKPVDGGVQQGDNCGVFVLDSAGSKSADSAGCW